MVRYAPESRRPWPCSARSTTRSRAYAQPAPKGSRLYNASVPHSLALLRPGQSQPTIVSTTSDRRAPFIPAWLDDLPISPKAMRVLIHLWRRRNGRTGQCNPAAESVAQVCRLSRATVWAALRELEMAGLVTRAKHGFRGSNQYELKVSQSVKSADDCTARESVDFLDTNRSVFQMPTVQETDREGSPLKVPNEGEGAERPSRSRFAAPSRADWLNYADELQWSRGDASAAFDHYEACGWRQARGNPIRNWRAAARCCQRRQWPDTGRTAPRAPETPLRMISP